MDRRKAALALLVVGLLLLPAPFYLGWAAQATAPPPRTSQVYAAERIDLTNESDRQTVVGRHWTEVAFSVHQLSEPYSAGEYRSPNVSRAALRTAMQNGSATVDDPGAKADLREVAAANSYVTDAYSNREQYYRLRVEQNGSVVRTEPVSNARIANMTTAQAPRHENLSSGEQRTVDQLLTNASADWGHRPRVDEPFVDRLPTLVWKDGTLYSIYVTGHVDDVGPGFTGFVYGMVAAAVGLVLVLASLVLYGIMWWRE